jgi:uncharacterized protein (DUF885 family)
MLSSMTHPTFGGHVDAFLAEYFALHPLRATEAGMHDHDGRWHDVSEAGRAERLVFYDRWTERLRALPDDAMSADERIDRDLLLADIDRHRFVEAELREERWNGVAWAYALGDGIFPLLARDFAPLADRLASVAGRLEGIGAVVDAAIAELVGLPDRPVSRLHAETALDQLPGVAELADDAVREAEAAAAADPAIATLLPRLRTASDKAKAHVDRLATHIRDVVLPAANGDGLLGKDLFARKLRHTLEDPELTPERVLARAEREVAAVRAEMVRLARDLWPTWNPGQPLPTAASDGDQAAADQRTVRTVLDAIAADHPAADDLLDVCREELARIEAFCRDHGVIDLAPEPLDIRWTPVFLRAFGGAMLIPPGPLDRGQQSFFAITPIPDDWPPERVESWLREDNARMIRVLTIHEAVPGHYLQLAYANRSPSLVRSIFASGVFAEGWAVYVTQVMMDLGYGAEDPALMLVHWKFYLRAAMNAVIDVRIQTGGMTTDEAVRFMVEDGFQEQAEAVNKDKRARISSTQLSTYFVGSMGFWEIEVERRRRLAAAAGADPAAIVAGDVPGRLGHTPGFDYKAHLEDAIAHGTPPLPLLRRILFD